MRRIVARDIAEVHQVLEGIVQGDGVPEFDNQGAPTIEWEERTGVLHCATCRAYCLELYGAASECADCQESYETHYLVKLSFRIGLLGSGPHDTEEIMSAVVEQVEARGGLLQVEPDEVEVVGRERIS